MRIYFSVSKTLTAALLLLAALLSAAALRPGTFGWSRCSRSCGGGVMVRVSAKCPAPGHPGCAKHSHQYRTCQTKLCPKGSVSFREQQCQEHNGREWRGAKHTWHALYNPLQACALWCKDEETNSIARLAPVVKDGTRCDARTNDMCIVGQCRRVGCDGIPGSSAKVDKCGVCSGDGSSCTANVSHVKYQWHVTKLGQCSASCGIGVQHVTSQCRHRASQKLVPNKHCLKLPRPDSEQQCETQPCGTHWYIGSWEPCSVSCGNGRSLRVVYCSSLNDDGKPTKTSDKQCRGLPRPTDVRSCSEAPCPRWRTESWQECSQPCGGGTQERRLLCVSHTGDSVSASQCDSTKQPQNKRKCNLQQCKGDRPELAADEFNLALPSFVTSEWSACSATCGPGSRKRQVTCRVFFPFSKSTVEVPEEECKGFRPTEVESCNLRKCELPLARDAARDVLGEYAWRVVGYSACSKTCLGGEERAIIKCFHSSTSRVVAGDYCQRGLGPAPDRRRACNNIPCPPQWSIGEYGACTAWCGGGSRNRSVVCVQLSSSGEEQQVPLAFCPHPRPPHATPCARAHCPPSWEPGPWSQCSSTCGGVQHRQLFCSQMMASGDVVSHGSGDSTPCRSIPPPVSQQKCGPVKGEKRERGCKERKRKPRIVVEQLDTVQMRRMKRLYIVVGGSATVLPGTSIQVRCPVKKFDQKKVKWLKDGLALRLRGRIKISTRGALRIRRARSEDSGRYTCSAGPTTADMQLHFQSALQGKKLYQERLLYLRKLRRQDAEFGKSQRAAKRRQDGKRFNVQADEGTGAKQKHDRKAQSPVSPTFVAGEWSECSASCGEGSRSRRVRCEGLAKNYFQVLDDSFCLALNQSRPHHVEFCQRTPICAVWTPGPWGKCSSRHCESPGLALRFRSTKCTTQNGTELPTSSCDPLTKPDDKSECFHHDCKVFWKPGPWSKCSTSCDTGNKQRAVACLWAATGKVASTRLCSVRNRPTVTEKCIIKSCKDSQTMGDSAFTAEAPKADCKDVSQFCNLYEMLEMCNYASYRQQCCRTCMLKHKPRT